MKIEVSLSLIVLLFFLSCEPRFHEQKVSEIDVFLKKDSCGDLLKQFAKKPRHLEFIDCNKGEEQTIFKANYRVQGKNAALVEKFLIESYKMDRLKFICCGWQPEIGKLTMVKKSDYIANKGINIGYFIRMYSSETLIVNRNDWNKIPYFYVTVEVIMY